MPVHITPLTPLAFLERSASVFADEVAVVHGDRRITYRELAAEVTRVARALQASGVGRRRPRGVPVPQRAGPAGGPLRGAPRRRRAGCRQHTARARGGVDDLHPLGGAPDAVVDTALAGTVAPVARPPVGGRGDLGRRRGARPRGPPRRRLRGPPRARVGRAAAVGRRGRGRDDLHQLHLGHDRDAQGRDVHAPRRVSQQPGREPDRRPRAGHGLPLDAADVPLQRVVPPLGDRRLRRRAGVPAGGARRRHLAPDRRGGHHPPQRRPRRAVAAGQLGARPPPRAPADGDDGRGAAQPDDPRPDRGPRRPRGARLRAHRDLRPVHRVPMADGAGPARSRPSVRACSPARAWRW